MSMEHSQYYRIYKQKEDIAKPYELVRELSNSEFVAIRCCNNDPVRYEGELTLIEIQNYIFENHKDPDPEELTQ